MLNTFTQCQNLVKPNGFGDICEKLLSDPYVLFLVKVAMFFDESKIPTSSQYRMPQETFTSCLVLISQVVSEEKGFVQLLTTTTDDDDDGHQGMAIAHLALGQVS